MILIHKKKQGNYIKNCLLKFSVLEKEILKTILQSKVKNFPLTKNSPITKKFSDLRILFKLKDSSENNLHSIYYLNKDIFNLIARDSELKNIYL